MLISPFTPDSPEPRRAARLADDFLLSAAEDDAAGRFPHAHIRALREAGLLGLTAPARFGGGGAGLAIAAEVIREVGRGDPAAALILVMQYAHIATLHRTRWDPALVEMVVTGAVQRGELINALRVEPDLGTPLRGGLPQTTARRVADGWRLSGRKIYSTGSEGLTWGIVWARTEDDHVGQFLVPMSAAGVRIERSWDTLGLRASSSHDVILDDAPGYAADIRRPEDWGADGSGWIALLLAALYTGVAEAGRDWIAGFLRTRVPANLGKPLAELPRMQEALGAIEERLVVNRRLIRSAAAEVDAGVPLPEAAILKHVATENAIAAVEQALKLAGNHAIARRNPLERHYRDVLCGRIHSPQEDSVRITAGRAALGFQTIGKDTP
ncbi:acyl-CoA dehydrogenase family protein [Paenirhodobacter sp.]|uniref:acyl-CoA dehydrogenase family protein n=1 Tax=Paenirhodobacter sp. TaxID=1965326 RepID=UPI003B3C7BE7